jgi:hypothetical protein
VSTVTRINWQVWLVVGLLAISGLGCNLINNNAAPTAVVTLTSAAGAPGVTINSPSNGSEVLRGQEVLIQSTAQDTIGVTRVELRVNGFIVNTVASEEASGEQLFSVIQSWTPAETGTATLEVIAYRASVASVPARLTLNVRGSAAEVTATIVPPAGVTQPAPEDTTCRARVEVNGLNFRTGPATNYPILRVLSLGQLVEIVGRLGDNTWWRVQDGLDVGWISSAYTAETGDCSVIPLAVPPPSPTPRPATATPTPTLTPSPLPGTPTPIPSPTPSVPDLVVESITGPGVLQLNASGSVGAQYIVRVWNQGTGNSGEFTTSFRLPDGTTTLLPIVLNLAPGQGYDLTVNVTFTASDNYRLEATVDSGQQVSEYDEGNNIRTLDVVITVQPMLSVTLPEGGIALTPADTQ